MFFKGNMQWALLNFTLFPCYGSLDWYLNIGTIPVPDQKNGCALKWDPSVKKTWCSPPVYNGTTYNILAKGLRSYTGAPLAAAKFDFAIYTSNAQYDMQVPVPGGGGNLEGSLLDGLNEGERQTLTMKWVGTGQPNDTYHVYKWEDNPISEDSGFHSSSACGIKEFMIPVTGITITNNENQFSTQIGDLDPEKELLFAVVVERPGGYINSYKTLRVNDSSVLRVSVVLLALCLFITGMDKLF